MVSCVLYDWLKLNFDIAEHELMLKKLLKYL